MLSFGVIVYFCLVDICPMNQFRCDNGTCIPISWACDRQVDCVDGSDEFKYCNEGIQIIALLMVFLSLL